MNNNYTNYFLVAIVLFLGSSSVHAITDGGPDGMKHPYVGLAVLDDADGNPLWRCSGTLIAPQLLLTAGHCTQAPAVKATIWFEENVDATLDTNGYPFGGPTSVDGTTYTHPLYDPLNFVMHDLGIIVLDEAVVMDAYAQLPTLGQLDPLKTKRGLQDVSFTAVGYGLQRINPVFVTGLRIRLQATLQLVDLNGTAGIPAGTSVMVSGNAHTGGTCLVIQGGRCLPMILT